jgi:hypothetical protein
MYGALMNSLGLQTPHGVSQARSIRPAIVCVLPEHATMILKNDGAKLSFARTVEA